MTCLSTLNFCDNSSAMRRDEAGGESVHWRILVLTALFLRVATVPAAAQTGDALHPCKLLTTAQLSAALGTLGAMQEGDMPG